MQNYQKLICGERMNPAEAENNHSIRILLVTNNTSFRRVTSSFLQRHKELILVGAVHGGEEALIQAQTLLPQMILLDLDMSGQAGLETIHCIHTLLPEIIIIALSLLDTRGYQQAALTAGANDFVHKIKLNTDLLPAIWRTATAGRSGPNDQEKGV
jgi:DNA-binding NarL/FixJ family response regulator